MKKRFIIPLIIIFSVILSICVSAQPSQADTPLENSESYTDVSVQESANQLYESLMSAFNSANGKNSSTPSQLSYPDAYGGAYINDSGKLVIYVVESKIEDSSDIDSTIEDISNFSPADNVLDSTTADYVLEPCEYSYTDLNNIMDLTTRLIIKGVKLQTTSKSLASTTLKTESLFILKSLMKKK